MSRSNGKIVKPPPQQGTQESAAGAGVLYYAITGSAG